MGFCKLPRETYLHFSDVSCALIGYNKGKNNPKIFGFRRFTPSKQKSRFFETWKNRVSLMKTSKWRHKFAKHTSKWVAVFHILGCLHRLSSVIHSRVMANNNFKSRDRGICGALKGFGFQLSLFSMEKCGMFGSFLFTFLSWPSLKVISTAS